MSKSSLDMEKSSEAKETRVSQDNTVSNGSLAEVNEKTEEQPTDTIPIEASIQSTGRLTVVDDWEYVKGWKLLAVLGTVTL